MYLKYNQNFYKFSNSVLIYNNRKETKYRILKKSSGYSVFYFLFMMGNKLKIATVSGNSVGIFGTGIPHKKLKELKSTF